jgi:tetratricopeptide (TPR) repeat protein
MGLLSWLFPTPETRIARARRHLLGHHYALARDEILELASEEANAVRREAEHGLVRLNLAAVVTWAESGEDQRVTDHLELAEELHHGGLEEEFRDTRRRLREIRTEREAEAAARRAHEARLARVDPLGLTGRGLLQRPGAEPDLGDTEEQSARLALALESYPADLRSGAAALGPEFATAILDLGDGRPDLALQGLSSLPDDAPLVCLERARAAHLLGDPAAAARSLRAFAARAGGHRPIGAEHTGEMLAQALAESGDPTGALRVLRDVRVQAPHAGSVLFAQLLEHRGELAEAEGVLRDLISRNPRQAGLYLMLARIRLAGGHRMPAMRALEQSLASCCEVPGKCGSQAPDPQIMRTLAILYLEDGIEQERALELAGKSLSRDDKPSWDGAYLHALSRRAAGDPDAAELAVGLWQHTPVQDPRRERLERYLPLPSEA